MLSLEQYGTKLNGKTITIKVEENITDKVMNVQALMTRLGKQVLTQIETETMCEQAIKDVKKVTEKVKKNDKYEDGRQGNDISDESEQD